MDDVYDVLAKTGQRLIECGDHRASLRSALTTVAKWASDVPDEKLRGRMELIRTVADEAKDIGLDHK
jgi:hypothetical protein